jgi:hypothetical protein
MTTAKPTTADPPMAAREVPAPLVLEEAALWAAAVALLE